MSRIFLVPALLGLISLAGLGLALLGGDSWWPAAWIGGLAPLLAIAGSLWLAMRRQTALT